MKSLSCFLHLSAVGSVLLFLIGCARIDPNAGSSPKLTYATFKWTTFVGERTVVNYSYVFEKSEEEVLRACLASATHYPPPPKGAVADSFLLSHTPQDALQHWLFSIHIDGEMWLIRKEYNEWHAYFDIADRGAKMKLYSLLQQIFEKQPPHILENPLSIGDCERQ